MSETVKIVCENNNSQLYVNKGASLMDVAEMLALPNDYPFLACYVNNKLKELDYNIYSPVSLRFIDITHFEGMRVYQRTLFFTLNKAVRDVFPDKKLYIKHSVSKGFYCEIEGFDSIGNDVLDKIRARMTSLVAQDIPIVRQKLLTEEAEAIYAKQGAKDKISLIKTRPHLYVTVYGLADIAGYFYGALAPSTAYIHLFDIQPYYKGFHLAVPKRTAPGELEPMILQEKMFDVFTEYKEWVNILEVGNIGSLNAMILDKKSSELIKIAEAFHEKKFASIADMIYDANRSRGARIALISGPSSSGKTTCAKRLGIQLRILGLSPVMISLDDYFVEREQTPRGENGDYDYEALEALDLPTFNRDLKALLDGEAVDVPRYDFITGKRQYTDRPLKLCDRSILVIEGIHGLNPALTSEIDDNAKFRIYISAFTSISMDDLTRIPTTDNRLIRRMVRDYAMRGSSATDTLRRWGSVRRGEDKHIFPFQEQADVMFNSSLFYEIAILRNFVEPLLHEVPDNVPEYGEAYRLLKFLENFTPITDPAEIPPTSILREFIGGSSFIY